MTETVENLIVAIATEDGVSMPKSHFGEALQFEIYSVSAGGAEKRQTVRNPHAEEKHGDGQHHGGGNSGRGNGIGRLLGEYGVQVMVSRAFGPNIQRMRQRFVPVKVDVERPEAALTLLQSHWDEVVSRWQQGESRKHLVLR